MLTLLLQEVPPSPDAHLCGRIYLLAVIDSQNNIWERDESNNRVAVPVTVKCHYGLYLWFFLWRILRSRKKMFNVK